MSIIGIFISVIMGLSLTNTVSDYGAGIVSHANSSEILVAIAPFIGVVWFGGCMGIAGLLAYGIYRKNK